MNRFQHDSATDATHRVLERMELPSMIPTDVESNTQIVDVIDQDFTVWPSCISDYCKVLEANEAGLNPQKSPPRHPQQSHHSRTTFESGFVIPSPALPEVGTYTPEYEVVAPSPLLTSIGTIPKTRPRMQNASTAQIVDHFSKNVRGFRTSYIHNLNDHIDPDIHEVDHRIHSRFEKQVPRGDLAFRSPSRALSFYQKPATPPRVPIFSDQLPRPDCVREYNARDYNDSATEQWIKLQVNPKVSKFDRQFAREYIPPQNERVAFLSDLNAQQAIVLNKLKPKRSTSQSTPKVTPGFEKQASREATAWYRNSDSFPDSKYPCNPLKSLRHVWPRVKTVEIRPPSDKQRNFEGPDFWTAHKGA
jgi:hypothetical protein